MEPEIVFDEANPRQQAHVDAEARLRLDGREPYSDDNPDGFAESDVFEIVSEETPYDPYSKGYIAKMRRGDAENNLAQCYEGVVEYRMDVLANERDEHEGTVTTQIGKRAYSGPEEGPFSTVQYLSERPVQDVQRVDSETFEVSVQLSKDELFEFLRGSDEETAKDVFDQLI